MMQHKTDVNHVVYFWQVMVSTISTVKTEQTLLDALKELSNNKLSAIPVINNKGLVTGIVTSQQILERIYHGLSLNVKIATVMKANNYLVVNRNDVINPELNDNFELICVCEKDALIGVVYPNKLLQYFTWKTQMLSRFEVLCEEYEMTLKNCYDSIYVTDADGNVLWVNSASERITLKPPVQVIGKNVQNLEIEQIFFPSVTSLVLQRKKCITIFQEVRKGDKVVCTGTPVFDDNGKLIRVVTVTRDVSKLIENIEQSIDTSEMEALFYRLKEANRLNERYYSELRQLRRERIVEQQVIGSSKGIINVLEMVKKVAAVDTTILILGESGVGKGVVATLIHETSDRKDGPFMKINCGAIPENLLESELFGYEAGAFTGARKEKKLGLIEMADKGTLFLDEIAELSLNLQVKLLQVIQDKNFIPVGGTKNKKVDVRIIAATNKDIELMVKKGLFREDLFYRLNVVPVVIPPLRHRKEDIPQLIMYFLDKVNLKYCRNKELSSKTMDILINYEWVGNVRELENVIEYLVVVCEEDIIQPHNLPESITKMKKFESLDSFNVDDINSLKQTIEDIELKIIEKVYSSCNSTIKTAKILGVNQSTIVRKLKKYEMLKKGH